jgi:hypothetical protein
MTKPWLLITVDTELSNFPNAQGLWGRVGNEAWGLERLIETFAEIGIGATFFLDVYAKKAADCNEQRRAAEVIAAGGQDLQLHTHPGPAFDPTRPRLRDYSLEEQEQIIEFGCERIRSWVGQRPFLHRAGDWGADTNSLQALKRCGIRADFSASAWSPNCAIDKSITSCNGWAHVDGLLCGMGTCYRDRITGRMRRVDLGGVSFREVLHLLSHKIDPFILTLHSFSLLRYDSSRTRFEANPGYIELLRRLCTIARDEFGYRVGSAAEAVADIEGQERDELPRTGLPTTSFLASGAGILKSIHGRLGWAAP